MRLGRSFLDRWIPPLGAALFRLLGLTLRYRIENAEQFEALWAAERPTILTSWHNRLMMGVCFFRRYRPVIAVSHSSDGDRIAGTVRRLGWDTPRGSSSRGGVRALLGLVREVSSGRVGIHLVDGPKGPPGVIKPGLMLLAQRSGAPIFLVYASARPRVRAPSWDRMEIPLPFARVHFRFEEPVVVPRDMPPEEVETLRRDLEKRLADGLARLDAEVHGSAQ
ncbi:MAG: lysophospholipid acyltransferase family protein [Deltaproteobacteria bacterium]|nr:lysophospholipid acyltransferase family protein [Deltaproteobacteria bacterium]